LITCWRFAPSQARCWSHRYLSSTEDYHRECKFPKGFGVSRDAAAQRVSPISDAVQGLAVAILSNVHDAMTTEGSTWACFSQLRASQDWRIRLREWPDAYRGVSRDALNKWCKPMDGPLEI